MHVCLSVSVCACGQGFAEKMTISRTIDVGSGAFPELAVVRESII